MSSEKKPVAEIKTTVYADKQGNVQAGTGTNAANLGAQYGDRTEGNQNWGQTGSVMAPTVPSTSELKEAAREYTQDATAKVSATASNLSSKVASKVPETPSTQDLKEKAQESVETAKSYANQAYDSVASTLGLASSTTKEKASDTSAAVRDKWEEGKEKVSGAVEHTREKFGELGHTVGEKMEAGRDTLEENLHSGQDKLAETYESGKHKAMEAKDYTMGTSTNVVERVKESVGSATESLQQKGHEWAESAQHTLEAAREKAREVFSGAGAKVDEATSSQTTTTTTYGTNVKESPAEIRIKTTESSPGNVDKIKVETRATGTE